MLIQHHENVFTKNGVTKILGSQLNIRMTIILLNNGNIALIDPIPFNQNTNNEIKLLGPVEYIIAPNKFHHLYIAEWATIYPQAQVLVSPGLPKRIKAMQHYDIINTESMHKLQPDLKWLLFESLPILDEIVLFHESSQTLIITDLAFNIQQVNWSLVGLYIRMSGAFKKFGPTWMLKLLIKNNTRARIAIDTILKWDIERIIMAHGEIIQQDAKQLFTQAFSWLK